MWCFPIANLATRPGQLNSKPHRVPFTPLDGTFSSEKQAKNSKGKPCGSRHGFSDTVT